MAFSYKAKPVTYKTAESQVSKQLKPLYDQAVKGLNQQKYQNDLNAGSVAQKRGLSHSGLAADQLTKIAVATQGQIADLNAQKSSKTAEMAQDLVNRSEDVNDRRRSQAFQEYMTQKNYNYQVGRDKVQDSQWNKQWGHQLHMDRQQQQNFLKQFGYQKGRDKVADSQWAKQFEWAKKTYGEDAAWRLFQFQSELNNQKSMNNAQLSYYKNAGFSSGGGGGGTSNIKFSKNYSNYGGYSSFQKNMQAAVSRGVNSAWVPLLTEIVKRESSFNPNAKNPKSTAYGYGQFLKSTRANYERKTGLSYSNPVNQLIMMAQYVKDRYGTPAKALDFWNKNHWY